MKKQMKKQAKNIFALCLLLILGTSCSEDFLDRVPTDAISEQVVFTTTDNARAALNGIHRFMHVRVDPPDRQDSGGQGSIMISLDMLGDDLVMSSTGNGWYNAAYRWINHRNENFSLPQFSYRFYYRIIANANLIINNIDAAEGSDADKNEIKGQALTYRAFSYHMLVQLFGLRYDPAGNNTAENSGVPLVLTASQEGLPRNTVEEVYTQINADLDEAIGLLETAPARAAKSHINHAVALGMKARVALTMGNWTVAADYAEQALAGQTLMSQADYTDGFNEIENVEWMWGSDQIQDQQIYFASFFAYMSHNFSSTNIRTNPKVINQLLYDQIPDTDIRKANFAKDGLTADELPTAGSLSVPYQNRKFTAESSGSSVGDVPYMRAAELHLIKAEALSHAGQDAQAAQALYDLNSARDGSYVLSTQTGQDLLDEILVYRRMELWGEGFRFLDLKRLNLSLDRNGSNHNAALANIMDVPAGDDSWQFLFPIAELNANPAIVQNK